jgi:hypothetical protein
MSKDHNKAFQALEALLSDASDLSEAELRADLEAQGVDVDAFLARFSTTVRTSIQRQAKLAAQTARADASQKKTRRFGDLLGKPMAELLAIFERIRAGDFGASFQQAAVGRCRNLQDKSPSESELRSWLEDISAMDDQ